MLLPAPIRYLLYAVFPLGTSLLFGYCLSREMVKTYLMGHSRAENFIEIDQSWVFASFYQYLTGRERLLDDG